MSRESNLKVIPIVAGGATFGVNVTSVAALQRLEELEVNPEGNNPIGWVNYFNLKIPVSDLTVSLGGRWTPSAGRRIVIIHAGKRVAAYLVDSAGTPMVVDAASCFPVPAALKHNVNNVITGVAIYEEQPILLLSAEAMLQTEPQPTLAGQVSSVPSQGSQFSAAVGTQPGTHTATRQLITFGLPSVQDRPFRLGLSTRQVPELIETPLIMPVPGARQDVCGLTSWRSEPVVVIDLGVGLGLVPHLSREIPCLLIARMSQERSLVGIPVNRDVTTVDLKDIGACELPPDLNETAVRGFYKIDGQPIMIPNIDHVVGSALNLREAS